VGSRRRLVCTSIIETQNTSGFTKMAVAHSDGGVDGWDPGPPQQHLRGAGGNLRPLVRAPSQQDFLAFSFNASDLVHTFALRYPAWRLARRPASRRLRLAVNIS
jgi:hypothetical protein